MAGKSIGCLQRLKVGNEFQILVVTEPTRTVLSIIDQIDGSIFHDREAFGLLVDG